MSIFPAGHPDARRARGHHDGPPVRERGQAPAFIPLVLVGSVALALALAGTTMLLSSFFLRVLGRTGVSVIERIMGIVLTGLSVQFVYDGLLKLGVLAASPGYRRSSRPPAGLWPARALAFHPGTAPETAP